MSETVLLTGADGYVGGLVVERLVAGSDARLILAVRAGDAAELATKRARLTNRFGSVMSRPRVAVIGADLRAADPLAGVDPTAVTHIVHAAAVTRFNVERDLAQAANVDGTDKVAAFARRCPRLRRLVALSTVYSAGRRTGPVDEVAHTDVGFVNAYEWSKWEAEHRLLAAGDEGLPVAIARLGTVIAEDDSGRVVQHNAFHNTFRLLYHGLLSVVPGEPDTPVYLLTGTLAAAATVHLLAAEGVSGIYHVCPEHSEAITLGRLLDEVLAVFEASSAYRARRLLRPLLVDRTAFAGLVAASASLGASPLAGAVASVAPFADQLFLPKEVHNRRLRQAFPDYVVPDARELVRATAGALVATNWGRAVRRAS